MSQNPPVDPEDKLIVEHYLQVIGAALDAMSINAITQLVDELGGTAVDRAAQPQWLSSALH